MQVANFKMNELLEADLLDAVVAAVCEEYTSSKEVVTRRADSFLVLKRVSFGKRCLLACWRAMSQRCGGKLEP